MPTLLDDCSIAAETEFILTLIFSEADATLFVRSDTVAEVDAKSNLYLKL